MFSYYYSAQATDKINVDLLSVVCCFLHRLPWQVLDQTMAMEVSSQKFLPLLYCLDEQVKIDALLKSSAPEPVYEEPETGYGPPDDG